MSCLRYQPSARRAKATIQGMPTKSFGLQPLLTNPRALAGVQLPRFESCFGLWPPLPRLLAEYESPEIEPQRPILAQHPANFAEAFNHLGDVLLWGALKAELC